jgi:hypothetical protein
MSNELPVQTSNDGCGSLIAHCSLLTAKNKTAGLTSSSDRRFLMIHPAAMSE